MTDEWTDDDCPKIRAAFGFLLRAHIRHQDGRHSLAPQIIFADYDYEVGDGKCGIWEDAKSANEPAIVYARADALIDAADLLAAQAAENARLREALRPFAALGADWVARNEDRSHPVFGVEGVVVTFGQIMDARAALTGEAP